MTSDPSFSDRVAAGHAGLGPQLRRAADFVAVNGQEVATRALRELAREELGRRCRSPLPDPSPGLTPPQLRPRSPAKPGGASGTGSTPLASLAPDCADPGGA
jgi:hypothetical protein